MIIEPKIVQSDEEWIDLFSSTSQRVQKLFFFFNSRMVVQFVKVEPQLVEAEPQSIEIRSKGNQGSTVTCQTLNVNI